MARVDLSHDLVDSQYGRPVVKAIKDLAAIVNAHADQIPDLATRIAGLSAGQPLSLPQIQQALSPAGSHPLNPPAVPGGQSGGGGGALFSGPHDDRLASSVGDGSLWYETDRGLTYLFRTGLGWQYLAGVMAVSLAGDNPLPYGAGAGSGTLPGGDYTANAPIGGVSDAVTLSTAVLTGGADPTAWPITTKITQIDFSGAGFDVTFSLRHDPHRWPDIVPAGWGGPVQYTIWAGAQVAGTWQFAAIINVYFDQTGVGGNVLTASQYSSNLWYLNPVLAGHTPTVGESLAYFVTAGGLRGVSAISTMERSQVVTATFQTTPYSPTY